MFLVRRGGKKKIHLELRTFLLLASKKTYLLNALLEQIILSTKSLSKQVCGKMKKPKPQNG